MRSCGWLARRKRRYVAMAGTCGTLSCALVDVKLRAWLSWSSYVDACIAALVVCTRECRRLAALNGTLLHAAPASAVDAPVSTALSTAASL